MASQDISDSKPIVTMTEAKRLGSKRYFTGKKCKRGHLSERLVSTRQCLACMPQHHKRWYKSRSAEKIDEYNKKQKQRRDSSPERYRNYAKTNYQKHKEKRKADAKNRYLSNREKSWTYAKEWRRVNRDKARAIARKWAANNAEAMERWRKENPGKVRVYAAVAKSRRRIRIIVAGGSFTKYDIDRIYAMQRGRCAYCRKELRSKYHIDHIVPLAKGGTNFPSNLQLCCGPCNVRKSDRDAIEYSRSVGLLL